MGIGSKVPSAAPLEIFHFLGRVGEVLRDTKLHWCRNFESFRFPAAEFNRSMKVDGGRYMDRTCDPYDVNIVSYRKIVGNQG
jgi:hypothetical protein